MKNLVVQANNLLNNPIGIGLKNKHYADILETQPDIGWFEVHIENYFYSNNRVYKYLKQVAELYPISIHGVALSLGSKNSLSNNLYHLTRIKKIIKDINPILVSEHLSWSMIAGKYLPDLLPVPYTDESADIFIENIKIAQDFLERKLLIENPSSYFEYSSSYINEAEFLVYIAQNSGCNILLDVNNIYVSCVNHNWDRYKYIDVIYNKTKNNNLISEIHLAGHSKRLINKENNKYILVDTHSDIVCPEVWDLYNYVINKFGVIPTLVEWDENIPSLEVLISEAKKAQQYLDNLKTINLKFDQVI